MPIPMYSLQSIIGFGFGPLSFFWEESNRCATTGPPWRACYPGRLPFRSPPLYDCVRSAPPVRITQQSLLFASETQSPARRLVTGRAAPSRAKRGMQDGALSGSPVPPAALSLGRLYAHAVDEDKLPTQPATEAQE